MSSQASDGSRQLESELAPLRLAFTGFADETPVPASCPDSDRIWAAVHDELTADEKHELIHYTTSCPSCAEEWRLARDVGRSARSRARQTVVSDASRAAREPRSPAATGRVLAMGHRFRRLAAPLAGLAAAAVLLLVVALPRESPAPSEFRAGEVAAIRSLVPQGATLARDACLLRWSGIESALYTVLVSDANLVVVARADELTRPRFQVPAESLARLPAGAELYWQIEAVLPDVSSRASTTFVSRIE